MSDLGYYDFSRFVDTLCRPCEFCEKTGGNGEVLIGGTLFETVVEKRGCPVCSDGEVREILYSIGGGMPIAGTRVTLEEFEDRGEIIDLSIADLRDI